MLCILSMDVCLHGQCNDGVINGVVLEIKVTKWNYSFLLA